MSPTSELIDEMRRVADNIRDMSTQFSTLLADFQLLDVYPPKSERVPGWNGKVAVRCCGCGRFAHVLNGGDGYNSFTGEYDPWWEVECKRCGLMDGFVYAD